VVSSASARSVEKRDPRREAYSSLVSDLFPHLNIGSRKLGDMSIRWLTIFLDFPGWDFGAGVAFWQEARLPSAWPNSTWRWAVSFSRCSFLAGDGRSHRTSVLSDHALP
jgi:hypothetical protein